MSQLTDLIKVAEKRLVDVPEAFIKSVSRVERPIYNRIIELLQSLKVVDGKFVSSAANLRKAIEITSRLREVLTGSEYTNAVVEFASEFDTQLINAQRYYKTAFGLQALPEIAAVVAEQSKIAAVELLLNTAAEAEFLAPLANIIETSVTSGAGFSETLDAIQEFVLGNDKVDSRLMRYSKQISTDSFSIADREINSVVSDELELEWFLYAGNEIATTRAFCDERVGKYFHFKEIEAWGRGEKTPGFEEPSDGTWAGRNRDTNEQTIFSYCGGYQCRHILMPVSIFVVPKEDIQRAIDGGYFIPSEFEVAELGL